MDKLYLILDRDGSPVEQGVLESPPGTEDRKSTRLNSSH